MFLVLNVFFVKLGLVLYRLTIKTSKLLKILSHPALESIVVNLDSMNGNPDPDPAFQEYQDPRF
jgi:hypothetical protein